MLQNMAERERGRWFLEAKIGMSKKKKWKHASKGRRVSPISVVHLPLLQVLNSRFTHPTQGCLVRKLITWYRVRSALLRQMWLIKFSNSEGCLFKPLIHQRLEYRQGFILVQLKVEHGERFGRNVQGNTTVEQSCFEEQGRMACYSANIQCQHGITGWYVSHCTFTRTSIPNEALMTLTSVRPKVVCTCGIPITVV